MGVKNWKRKDAGCLTEQLCKQEILLLFIDGINRTILFRIGWGSSLNEVRWRPPSTYFFLGRENI